MTKIPETRKSNLNKFFGALAIFLSFLVVAILYLTLRTKFFHYDGVEDEWNITEKIKIQKIENYGFDLFLQLSEKWSTPIVGNCSVVFYDSANNRIFAVEKLNDFDSTFHEIKIIDSFNIDASKTTSKEFHLSTNNKMRNWSIDENNNQIHNP